MTPDQFTNWLSGFISALGSNPPTNEQFNTLKDNLEKVFNKVTPNRKIMDNHPINREGRTFLDCSALSPNDVVNVDLANNQASVEVNGQVIYFDPLAGPYKLVDNKDEPSGVVFLNEDEVGKMFGGNATQRDNSTRTLLENCTGPFDGEGQLLTC